MYMLNKKAYLQTTSKTTIPDILLFLGLFFMSPIMCKCHCSEKDFLYKLNLFQYISITCLVHLCFWENKKKEP